MIETKPDVDRVGEVRERLARRLEASRLAGTHTEAESRERHESRKRIEQELMDAYPEQFVFYFEEWHGDTLVPTFIVAGENYGDTFLQYHTKYANDPRRVATVFPAFL